MLLRYIYILVAVLALSALAAQVSSAQQDEGMIEAKYVGHKGYPGFTRLVFDTGGVDASAFKVNYDAEGRRAVFYPLAGQLAFSFAPVPPVDELVRDIDFVETEDANGTRGIVVRLGPGVSHVRDSRLTDPPRIILDVYAKAAPAPYMPFNRPVKTVALDPGHGGRSGGAAAGPLTEKDLALDIAVRARRILAKQGYNVVLTREKDQEVSPELRAGAANAAKADVFVSLHFAGAGDPSGRGAVVYTMDEGDTDTDTRKLGAMHWADLNAPYLPDSLRLASSMKAALGKLYGADTEMHQARLAGVEGAAMPAVELELGSLADPAQAGQLADDTFRGKLAAKVAAGIDDFAKGTTK